MAKNTTRAGVPKLESLRQGQTLWTVHLLPNPDGSNTYQAHISKPYMLIRKPGAVYSKFEDGRPFYLSHELAYIYHSSYGDRPMEMHDMSGDRGIFPRGEFPAHNLNRAFTSRRQAERYARLYDGTAMPKVAIKREKWLREMTDLIDKSFVDEVDSDC
jgi:hypothetical protein